MKLLYDKNNTLSSWLTSLLFEIVSKIRYIYYSDKHIYIYIYIYIYYSQKHIIYTDVIHLFYIKIRQKFDIN
ncbi:hypothetical protein ACMBCM_08815, partial [Spiroplasma sp. K1]